MKDWLSQLLTSLSLRDVLLWASAFLLTSGLSIALVSFLLVKLPADFFQGSRRREFMPGRPLWLRWGGLIAKNFAGALLFVAGVVMAVPGVPGPGLVVILLAVVLLDVPGKRRLEHKLLGLPSVLATVNRLRGRFDRPPLVLD
ncbi:MAG TPA: hypothetical protein VF507_08115 [Pyrinomonadaceae bacterium]|jgi:hypothetical protein